eukprot:4321569-Pleurochrysis_carterae.AAC.2
MRMFMHDDCDGVRRSSRIHAAIYCVLRLVGRVGVCSHSRDQDSFDVHPGYWKDTDYYEAQSQRVAGCPMVLLNYQLHTAQSSATVNTLKWFEQ